jgi:ABC-type antimicrobial peptide transport system permease subunit
VRVRPERSGVPRGHLGDGEVVAVAILFALLLAAVGVYGVLTYAFSERTSEIGVRLALGAGRSRIVMTVLRDGARFVMPGLLVGLAAAFAMANVVASLLFETDARDPIAFAVAPAILLLVALVAAYIPAPRGSTR